MEAARRLGCLRPAAVCTRGRSVSDPDGRRTGGNPCGCELHPRLEWCPSSSLLVGRPTDVDLTVQANGLFTAVEPVRYRQARRCQTKFACNQSDEVSVGPASIRWGSHPDSESRGAVGAVFRLDPVSGSPWCHPHPDVLPLFEQLCQFTNPCQDIAPSCQSRWLRASRCGRSPAWAMLQSPANHTAEARTKLSEPPFRRPSPA